MPFETVTQLPLPPNIFCDILGRLVLQYTDEFGPDSPEVTAVMREMEKSGCPTEFIPVPGKDLTGFMPAVDIDSSNGQTEAEIYLSIVRRPTTA
jgi:hypothetical protein